MKTNNLFKSFVACAVLLYAAGMNAQSRYFDERYIYTQAQVNPQLINPGAIGSAMKHQVLLNYRNKWSGNHQRGCRIELHHKVRNKSGRFRYFCRIYQTWFGRYW